MLRTALIAAALLAIPAASSAGDLTPKAAGEVVDQVIRGLETYVDPQVAKAVQTRLRANRAAYAKLGDRAAFAQAVSRDLVEVSHDKHLKVTLTTVQGGQAARLSLEQEAAADAMGAHGFMAARRLPANIGYIKLRKFDRSEEGAAMIEAILGVLKATDALIIDLRENGGGGGASDETLLGHLARAPIPMAKVHWRNDDGTEELMSREPRAPAGGPLYADKPVYLLTSVKTFSAAEEFAYDLKAAKRAVLVGETTGGGANAANRPVPLSYGLKVFIPNGRVEHPTTGGNWEGVGIAPDVAVPAGEALVEAYRLALAAAKPALVTPQSEAERTAAIADPLAVLKADAGL